MKTQKCKTTGKAIYYSEESAEWFIDVRHHNCTIYVYQCEYCFYWHWTKQQRDRKAKPRIIDEYANDSAALADKA